MQLNTRVSAGDERESDHVPGGAVEPTKVVDAAELASPGVDHRTQSLFSETRLPPLKASGVAKLLVDSCSLSRQVLDTATLRASTGLVVFLAHDVVEVADDVHDPVDCASNISF
ncbi:hypothetical protein ISCGN_007699 [Ixodes scapularis]